MQLLRSAKLSIGLLSERDRRLYLLAGLLQCVVALLDLAGILLFGVVGALSVTVIQSTAPPAPLEQLLQLLGIEDWSPQGQVAAVGLVAAFLLVLKSVVSWFISRRVYIFLANRQAVVSARLTEQFFDQDLQFVHGRPLEETAWALVQGVSAATTVFLGQGLVAISEVALFVILFLGLLFVNPILALLTLGFFGLILLFLSVQTQRRAHQIGQRSARADIRTLGLLQALIAGFREISVAQRKGFFLRRIHELRWEAARVSADRQLVMSVPKYVLDIALILGGVCLTLFLFATMDAIQAVAVLSVFLVASARLMPSLLRLQTATIVMRDALGSAGRTIEMVRSLSAIPPTARATAEQQESCDRNPEVFKPTCTLSNVSFTYLNGERPALQDVSLAIPFGQMVALVGPSGSGKSTLVDLVLGLLSPSTGEILIAGMAPVEALRAWPGQTAYVPQRIPTLAASLRENVALGIEPNCIDDEQVLTALDLAGLTPLLTAGRLTLETEIGPGSTLLSGGESQRLGLARALYSKPRLLVLDEATSALDAGTEANVMSSVRNLRGQTTCIVIAHRLSTVKDADLVVCLDKGRKIAEGTFEQVVSEVPLLNKDAKYLGIA